LLDALRILFSKPVSLNPATLLPNLDLEAPLHDCQEIIAEITQVHPDLQDLALPNSELVWYTDGSSFVSDGVRKAGAAVVDQGGNIIWNALLPPGTSAQKAELIVLAEALEWAEGKRVTVYTDSRYTFSTIHVHGTIYRERGFITAEGKELRNLLEIQRLLIAVQKPQAVAVVHIPGHQSAQTPEAMGNRQADKAARNAALASMTLALTLPMPELPHLPPQPEYTLEDRQWILGHRCPESNQQGWYRDDEGQLILPEKLGLFLLSNLHRANHLGKKKLLGLLKSAYLQFLHQTAQIQRIVDQCAGCQAMKPSKRGLLHTGTRVRGRVPGWSCEVDFTEVKLGRYGYRYLLVLIDTFSGWVEAFPTKRETAQVVAKVLLEEIIPRHGIPETLGSDNRPAFISNVLQGLARAVGTNWKLHCEYNPQSSGQVERMNWTLKRPYLN
jgi:ribonuclease HI